jgi:hypothetical protein
VLESVADVEVTDPTHPLFGRRFPLLSVSSRPNAVGYVYVSYREYMILRIPKDATNLAPAQSTLQTKLTVDAVEQLISVAEECKVLCQKTSSSCGQQSPKTSGSNYPHTPKSKSLTKCQKS